MQICWSSDQPFLRVSFVRASFVRRQWREEEAGSASAAMESGDFDLAPDATPGEGVGCNKGLHRRAVRRVENKQRTGHDLAIVRLQWSGHHDGQAMVGFGFHIGPVGGGLFQTQRQSTRPVKHMDCK